MEPCHLEQVPAAIADRTVELAQRATQLSCAVPAHTASDLAGLVRIMNCYYSNLIEGHNTRPRDTERALLEQFDEDRRDLQLEARAHIRVQAEIDRQSAEGTLPDPTSARFIQWIQRSSTPCTCAVNSVVATPLSP
jgi:Fic family protein